MSNILATHYLLIFCKSSSNKQWDPLKNEIDQLYLKLSSLKEDDISLRIALLNEIKKKENEIKRLDWHRTFVRDQGYNYNEQIRILDNELSKIGYPSNKLNTQEILVIEKEIDSIHNRIAKRLAIGLIPTIFNTKLEERRSFLIKDQIRLGINTPEQKQILLLLDQIQELEEEKKQKLSLEEKIGNLLTFN